MSKRKVTESNGDMSQAQADFVEQAASGAPCVPVMTFEEGWFVMECIKLALTHPSMQGEQRAYAEAAAAKLVRLVSRTPALSAMAAAGWPERPEPTSSS
jgi:hypothetical protein